MRLFRRTFSTSTASWLLVGLGNNEAKYAGTRHNLGRDTVVGFAASLGLTLNATKCNCCYVDTKLNANRVVLAHTTFPMNLSGTPVSDLALHLKIPFYRVAVVYDDWALPLGSLKLSNHCSDAGHNGIADVINKLPRSSKFVRIRIGIGRPAAHVSRERYVLSKFTHEELATIRSIQPTAFACFKTLVSDGLVKALNIFNQRPTSPAHVE
eukprot:TRINITY_DN959_c5_g1_i1.p1 TRINITY_DN959_c5_g1~~TRINITY_DN959_c5_g1_i1.p1  ORF type:complete len:210 (+),score=8.97 TRINITY_DN959_c5_g1_i1:50-679(+)